MKKYNIREPNCIINDKNIIVLFNIKKILIFN